MSLTQRNKRARHPDLLLTIAFVASALALPSSNTRAQSDSPMPSVAAEHDARLNDFEVIEFRRYTIKAGERKQFSQYFDAYFPEAFQQLGAIAAGSFFERNKPNGFTWIRGFHTINDRAIVNAAFYYGSVWNEHRNSLNDLLTDSDNVLLLRPLSPDRGVMILPAVDPTAEPNGAQGIAVAQVFAIKTGSVGAFATAAESTFAKYRAAGAREAGVLVTFDVSNNFPQLPVRTDGPFLVWLGLIKGDSSLKDFIPLAKGSLASLSSTGLIRTTPELIVLDPSPRSRLRWLSTWK